MPRRGQKTEPEVRLVGATGSTAPPYTPADIVRVVSEAIDRAVEDGVSVTEDPEEVKRRVNEARKNFTDERRARASAEAEVRARGVDDPDEVERLTAETVQRFRDQREEVASAPKSGRRR